MLYPLRPLQAKALDMLRASIRAGNRRIVVSCPTGFGKTICGAHIVDGALAKGNRLSFTVPRLSLIDQTFDRFVSNGISPGDIGVMQGNHPWRRPRAALQICSIPTIDRRGFPEAQNMVVVDECHIQYDALNRWMDERPEVLFVGLSATPWARGMGERWQDMIKPTTVIELIEQGWLCKFRVFAPSRPDLSKVKDVGGDYNEGQLSDVMSDKTLVADVVQNWIENGEDRPTLAFCVDRAHAALVHSQFEQMGVSAAYVDGDMDAAEREAILVRYRRGDVRVVVSIGTMTTGVDEDVRCIILARPTKSEMLYVQIIGRGLRIADGKDDCLIFDHTSTTEKLGFVTDIDARNTELRTAARDLAKKQARENGEDKPAPTPRECGKCKFLIPAGVRACPNCGAISSRPSTVKTNDGELVELGAGAKKPKKERSKVDEPVFYAQLLGFAMERSYKPGWAANKFKEKYGVWPNGPHVKDVQPAVCGTEVRSWIRSRQIAFAKGQEKRAGAADVAEMRRLAAEAVAQRKEAA